MLSFPSISPFHPNTHNIGSSHWKAKWYFEDKPGDKREARQEDVLSRTSLGTDG